MLKITEKLLHPAEEGSIKKAHGKITKYIHDGTGIKYGDTFKTGVEKTTGMMNNLPSFLAAFS